MVGNALATTSYMYIVDLYMSTMRDGCSFMAANQRHLLTGRQINTHYVQVETRVIVCIDAITHTTVACC